MTVEHSPVGRRGFFTSFVMVGYAVGCSLATIVFLPVALLPAEQLYSWGWRVPFWLSAVVVVITYYVRSHLDETPVFAEAKEGSAVRKLPLNDVFKYHWRDVIRVAGSVSDGSNANLVRRLQPFLRNLSRGEPERNARHHLRSNSLVDHRHPCSRLPL